MATWSDSDRASERRGIDPGASLRARRLIDDLEELVDALSIGIPELESWCRARSVSARAMRAARRVDRKLPAS